MRLYESILARILANALLPLLCLVICIATPPRASAASSTYAITQPGDFGTLNLSTGAFTKLGNAGTTPVGMGELGGSLYIGGQGSNSLYNVNLSNGSLTLVGNGSIPYAVFGATTSSLYGIGTDNKLYSISAATGASTLIGPTGLSIGSNTVAMSANASGLYVTLDTGSGSVLYSVSTATGLATTIGNTALPIHAMVYRNGLLYAAVDGGALFTLDPATGAATFVTNTRTGIRGMAEPASTLTVLYNFSGGSDGADPLAGVTMDHAGNLFGTASSGGIGWGTVYKLTHKNGAWLFAPLYQFAGHNDGEYPSARVVMASDGSLYGTTNLGGNDSFCQGQGCGTVFRLRPTPTRPPTPLTPWVETVLYRFQGGADGAYPGYGDLAFDLSGALYNTTSQGGTAGQCYGIGCGVIYKLTPSGQNWTESVLYTFTGGADGEFPLDTAVFDSAGNLDITANMGGTHNVGTVIQLTPSGGGWTENTIHQFTASTDGALPWSSVILDSSGNLYGTTASGGPYGGGTVYEMTPSGGGYTYKVLWNFSGSGQEGPLRKLAMDAAGNLYGTTYVAGAYRYGSVFQLSPAGGGNWTYTDLHDFTAGNDGAYPQCNLILDASGNLYGTAQLGGTHGVGVVYEITPQ